MVAIDFEQSKYGKATKLYNILTSLTIAPTGFDSKYFWRLCVDDGAS